MIPSSRREFLSRLGFGLTFVPAVAMAPKSLLGSLLFDPEGPSVPAKPLPPNPYRRNGKSLVVMVHGGNHAAMLQAGLDLLGGLDAIGVREKRVLVKPNVVNDRPPPTTTDARLVEAMVRAVTAAGARDVVVADSSGIIRFPTSENLATTGIAAAARSSGASLLALETEGWLRVEPAGAVSLPRYYVSKPVYEADVLINLPVVKTHRFAEFSCALKNVVGVVHPRYRPSVTFLAGDWHERIAELNLAVHPQLTVADGASIMIAGGPTSGTAAQADLLLLSGDRVALDAVAVAVIRSFGAWPKLQNRRIWEQRQLKRAAELNLGSGGPEGVELLVRSVDRPTAAFQRLAEAVRRDVGEG